MKNSDQQTTIYKPNQRHEPGFMMTWVIMAKNIKKLRDLIWQLFKRDFFAQYKKSFIGISWIFISPIIGFIFRDFNFVGRDSFPAIFEDWPNR